MKTTLTTMNVHLKLDEDRMFSRPSARMMAHANSYSLCLRLGDHETNFFVPAEMREWAEGVMAAVNSPVKMEVPA